MKKLLIGLLALGSFSTFASDTCKIDYKLGNGEFFAGLINTEENLNDCIETAKTMLKRNNGEVSKAEIYFESEDKKVSANIDINY